MQLSVLYIIVMAATFAACMVLMLGIKYVTSLPERRASKMRLKRYLSGEMPVADLYTDEVAYDQDGKQKKQRADLLPWLSKILAEKNITESITKELTQARLALKASEFVYIWIALTMVAFIAGMLITKNVIFAFIFAGIAFRLPFSYLKHLKHKWLNYFNKQIPDTLVLISNCLKSGYSFMQSIDMVAREALPPMSEECAKVLQEISLGNTVEKSLMNIVERIGSEDMDLVVTAVIIQREIGGSLAEILENIADTIRERIRIKGEVKTLTAQGRLSGYIVGSLPIALFFVINLLNHEYMSKLTTNILGWLLLGLGVTMQTIGYMVIKKLVDIEV
ncbi:MAG: type II secretion system F family protein [bacterium]|nr:type II secretion system F family protein [bacterium]